MIFTPSPLKRTLFFIFFDLLISLGTLFLAYELRFNFDINQVYVDNFGLVFIGLVSLKILLIAYFKIYKVSWRFFSLNEIKKLIYAHVIAYSLFIIIYYLFPDTITPFPRSILIIDLLLSIVFLGIFRFLKRLVLENGYNSKLKNTLLIGVSPFAQTLFKEKNNFYICAVVDDSLMTINTYFSGVKVNSFKDLESLVKDKEIKSVIISKELKQETLTSLYTRLKLLNIYDIKLAMLSKKETTLKNLTVEDLLARHPKDLDKDEITSFIKDKVILITGAGGSIGSEIARQCIQFNAKKLILLDHSEFNLYSISEELKDNDISCVMQTVVNINKLEETFKKYLPQIVIHAAAYKHVPLCEENIKESIENNIIGTKNTIDLSIKYSVDKFVLISTDKAVRPTNVMGTTKRICELYASNARSKNTQIVAVRFGNVLGSSGSVIPKFKSQIDAGQNITVTHPDITRYFMLIPEACELVLQTASIGKDGELFILDMGEPIKIIDLAKKMIELSGRNDIEIEFSGLRPGEKLYEELLINDSDKKTQYESITVANSTSYEINKLKFDINELVNSIKPLDKLKEMVPEFNHNVS